MLGSHLMIERSLADVRERMEAEGERQRLLASLRDPPRPRPRALAARLGDALVAVGGRLQGLDGGAPRRT